MALPGGCHACLEVKLRGQLAGHERHGQDQHEGEQVLRVGYREREARLDEEEVEARDAQERGPGAGDAPEAQGHEHDGQEKQPDHIGEVENMEQQTREEGRRGACQGRQDQRQRNVRRTWTHS